MDRRTASTAIPEPSLTKISSPPLPEAPKESVVTRLFIAPLTFISFLLSLALIDNHNSTLRHHIHAPSLSPSSDTVIGRMKATLHSWVYRPQPYAYVKSPAALEREKSGDMGKGGAGLEKEEPWHWHTKQRKMARMEVVDAFEMRHRVVIALVVAVAACAAGAVWLVRWCFGII